MDHDSDDSVIERVLKIQALANDARGNENVISIAAAQVERLMAKHNLTIVTIDNAIEWQAVLIEPIAKFNGARVIANTKFQLLGRTASIAALQAMLEHLTTEIAILAAGQFQTLKEVQSFYKGASDALIDRLLGHEPEPNEPAAAEIELSPDERAAQQAIIAKHDTSAYFAGRAAGDEIPLNPPTNIPATQTL
jgi:hypothetical protein